MRAQALPFWLDWRCCSRLCQLRDGEQRHCVQAVHGQHWTNHRQTGELNVTANFGGFCRSEQRCSRCFTTQIGVCLMHLLRSPGVVCCMDSNLTSMCATCHDMYANYISFDIPRCITHILWALSVQKHSLLQCKSESCMI